jgi:hypothetical protein
MAVEVVLTEWLVASFSDSRLIRVKRINFFMDADGYNHLQTQCHFYLRKRSYRILIVGIHVVKIGVIIRVRPMSWIKPG